MKILAILLILLPFCIFTQNYAPAANQIGSSAIHKDSSIILSWATGISLERGFLDISNKPLGKASFGQEINALYSAEGNSIDVVSLGDSGIAILTFDLPIRNGQGPDFAIFENGFADNYMELAFVEVSSDGVNYFRFPSFSEIQTNVQIGNFEYVDCRYIHNLAGKYRQGYGTPFDLEELKNIPLLDVENITHVKIIDVIGSIDSEFGSQDSQGNLINDPWPSAFESGGFDLDGVAVIHENPLNISIKIDIEDLFKIINNERIVFLAENISQVEIYNLEIKVIFQQENQTKEVNLNNLPNGIYFIKFKHLDSLKTYKFLKL